MKFPNKHLEIWEKNWHGLAYAFWRYLTTLKYGPLVYFLAENKKITLTVRPEKRFIALGSEAGVIILRCIPVYQSSGVNFAF